MKMVLENYYKQDDEEMDAFKVKLLNIIAQSDIKYLNLCKMQYELDDIIFKV